MTLHVSKEVASPCLFFTKGITIPWQKSSSTNASDTNMFEFETRYSAQLLITVWTVRSALVNC